MKPKRRAPWAGLLNGEQDACSLCPLARKQECGRGNVGGPWERDGEQRLHADAEELTGEDGEDGWPAEFDDARSDDESRQSEAHPERRHHEGAIGLGERHDQRDTELQLVEDPKEGEHPT